MKKSLIFAALLVPCFMGAVDKKARQEEIMQEVDRIQEELECVVDLMKHNLWVVFVSPHYFSDVAEKAKQKLIVLEEEYDQLEKEIEQEEHVS